jgi:hypothetical protein
MMKEVNKKSKSPDIGFLFTPEFTDMQTNHKLAHSIALPLEPL